MPVNKGLKLDLEWIKSIEINDAEITSKATCFTDKSLVNQYSTHSWLLIALNCVDLSLLFGNETPEAMGKLCQQAVFPLKEAKGGDLSKINKLGESGVYHCGAVCVYPLRIEDTRNSLAQLGAEKSVLLASVAAGFPTGQYPLHTRLAEINYAVEEGAHEIDVVIDRSLVLRGLWSQLYDELIQMRKACGNATLKVILSVTECGSWTNIYKASAVAMSAGADFIKTSTGKEAKTMTIHEGLVMCLAIKDFYNRTGVKVGLKPAGGIRTVEHAVSWMLMVQELLGKEWVNPSYFRIGTSGQSSLLENIANFLLQ